MMSRFKIVLLLSTLASFPTLADFDGNYIYSGYKDYDNNLNTQDAFAFMGFVRGVTAMLIVDKKICVDDNFAFSQAFDTVGNYLRSNPKARTVPPVLSVSLSLLKDYSCTATDK